MFLRALQLGLSYTEAFFMDVGALDDLMIERANDSYDYATIGTEDDFRRL